MRVAGLTSLGKVWEAAVSPDGKFLAYVAVEEGRQSVWVKQVESDSSVQIVPPAVMFCVGLTFSPDGNYVYYTAYPEDSNFGTVVQVPVIGGARRQVLADVDSPVTFSPDGRRLAFVRRHISSGLIEHALLVANADGTGMKYRPRYSPDGRWIVYSAIPPSQSRPALWKMPAEGGEPVQLTEAYSRIPSVSPDGRLVACYHWDSRASKMKLAVIPIEGGEPLKVFDPPRSSHHWSLQWTPDGRGLLYVETHSDAARIWRLPLDGGPPEAVVHFPSGNILDFAWSADGKRFACARGLPSKDAVAISGFR